MAKSPLEKIEEQIRKAGLPTSGAMPHTPHLDKNRNGQPIIKKDTVGHGPKKGKRGYVDTNGRIWIRDRAHGKYSDHWDVQKNGGKKGHIRVDPQGNIVL